MSNKLANLLEVKKLIALLLSLAFIYLAIKGTFQPEFVSIYTMIVGFYFGSSNERQRQIVTAEREEQLKEQVQEEVVDELIGDAVEEPFYPPTMEEWGDK